MDRNVSADHDVTVLCALPSGAIVGEESPMSVPLAPQVQESLGHSDLVIIPERVAAVALRRGQRVTMGVVEGLDRPLPRPWQQRERRWGWTAVRWLASRLPAGQPRQGARAASVQGRQHPLRHRSGPVSAPLEGRDDRLGQLLQHVRQPTAGPALERDVPERRRAGYAWLQDVLRGEATTGSGPHEGTARGG